MFFEWYYLRIFHQKIKTDFFTDGKAKILEFFAFVVFK